MASIELLLPNALSMSLEALSRETYSLNPKLEALDTSIQTPIRVGNPFHRPRRDGRLSPAP